MDTRIALPDDFRRQLIDQPGQPFRFEDAETKQVFFVHAQSSGDEWLDKEIEIGLKDFEEGNIEDWEIESIIAELDKEAASAK